MTAVALTHRFDSIERKCRSAAIAATLAAAIVLLSSAPSARAAKITGELSKSGYTVVAISTSGKVATAKAKGRSFKLKAPGGVVTIQLLDKRGRYAGPVVVGMNGRKAILGVKAGADLGKVRVGKGFAKPVKRLARKFVARSRTARTKKGVPVGARGFGLVRGARAARSDGATGAVVSRSRLAGRAPSLAAAGAGGDPDKDGVPTVLDIDANANGVIDAVDPNAPTAAGFGVFSQLVLDIDQSVNASATGVSEALIDKAMADHMTLVFTSVPADTELDCHGLTYCSLGGTGSVDKPPEEGGSSSPFPSCCDADADGSGTISNGTSGPTGSEFRLAPHAASSAISSGDTMGEVTGGSELLGSLGFVFKTVPAVKQLTDSGGGSVVFNYPVAAGAPGTQANPITLPTSSAGPMTFTLWRPQRRPIPGAGEGSAPIDIGLLDYQVQMPNAPGAPPPMPGSISAPQCPQASFATSDPNLKLSGGAIGAASDTRADTPADAGQTLTFSLDLASCIAARGGAVTPGSSFHLGLSAVSQSRNSVDHADQVIYFRFA